MMNVSNINSSSLNGTQVMDVFYYNWCKDHFTVPVIWSGFSVICFLLGFPASLMAFNELLQRQRQKVFNDMFMFSLALIDLAFTASLPLGLCNFFMWHNVRVEWLSNFIYTLMMIGRPLFMACVCGDCYIAVNHPIAYMTNKRLVVIKKTISITTWFIILGFGFIMSFMQWMITSPVSSIPLVIALPVIFYCDISVLLALRKPGPCGKQNIHPQKKQAIRTIFNSLFMTFIAYLPAAIILSFGNFLLTEIERACSALFLGVCFSMAGCVIMPILYLDGVGKLDTFKKWWKH